MDRSDIYITVLERLLNEYAKNCTKTIRYEVINLGGNGYDVPYEVERFKRHGTKYNPDLILWLINEQNVLMLNELLFPLQWKIASETPESAKSEYERQNIIHYASYIAAERLKKQIDKQYILSHIQRSLDTLASLYSGPLVISMFSDSSPDSTGIISTFSQTRKNTYINDSLNQVTVQNNTVLPDGHPNIKGHKQIAQQLFQYVTKKQIIPCQHLK
jgi:hypothetical protein